MLRVIRILLAALFFAAITFYFVDFSGLLPQSFHWLARIQVIPALASVSIIIVAVLAIVTLLLGRVYCSVICPMGVLQDVIARLARPFKNKKNKKYRYARPRNRQRWIIVAVSLTTFVVGLPFILAALDPYSTFGRIATSIVKPIYLLGNNLLASIFTAQGNYTFYHMPIVIGSVFTLVLAVITLLVIGYLAARGGRTWCNTVCPVGTLLGALSKYSLLRVNIKTDACTRCGRCARACKAACIDSKSMTIDHSRCVACYNCLGACRDNAIAYNTSTKPAIEAKEKPTTEPKEKPTTAVNESRRSFLALTTGTAALAPQALKAKVHAALPQKDKIYYKRKHAISPPGSRAHGHLLVHCTSCHLCVSKCPAGIIRPALMEYGIGGIMQPTISFEHGFCNYDCTICSEVCPNEAMHPLTVEEKHLTQTGYVVFLVENCIVNTDGTSCGACSEHCATQAVSMRPYKDALTLPHVDTDICIGCGGCEYVCPTYPKAIYIEGNPEHKEAKPFHDPEGQKLDIDGFGF